MSITEQETEEYYRETLNYIEGMLESLLEQRGYGSEDDNDISEELLMIKELKDVPPEESAKDPWLQDYIKNT